MKMIIPACILGGVIGLFLDNAKLHPFQPILNHIRENKNINKNVDKSHKMLILRDQENKEYHAVHIEGNKYEIYQQ
jgi:hypothetical protein